MKKVFEPARVESESNVLKGVTCIDDAYMITHGRILWLEDEEGFDQIRLYEKLYDIVESADLKDAYERGCDNEAVSDEEVVGLLKAYEEFGEFLRTVSSSPDKVRYTRWWM